MTLEGKGDEAMTTYKTGTREEWLAARLELLEAEKELTRHSDEVARHVRSHAIRSAIERYHRT